MCASELHTFVCPVPIIDVVNAVCIETAHCFAMRMVIFISSTSCAPRLQRLAPDLMMIDVLARNAHNIAQWL